MSNFNKKVIDYLTFNNIIPRYVYDKDKEVLKIDGKRDLQVELNDNRDCAIDKVIQKYGVLPDYSDNRIVNGLGTANFFDDPNDSYRDTSQLLEDIRDKYNLPVDISDDSLNKFLNEQIGYLKCKIDNSLNKGGVSDETKTNEPKEE